MSFVPRFKPGDKSFAGKKWYLDVVPLTFDRCRIVVTDGAFVEDFW